MFLKQLKKVHINQTDVIFNDNDLPRCCGLCDFGTPWISSLNDTDFSNDTDLSGIELERKQENRKNEKFIFTGIFLKLF
jgi:hypothetical protein